jgi:CheY-like chemotaxis protein
MRALIIDDDPVSCEVIAGMIPKSWRSTCVASAEDGLEAFSDHLGGEDAYDIVFIDHYLNGMNGVEGIPFFRDVERKQNVKLACKMVLVTGTHDPDLFQDAFNKKCDTFLLKPLDPNKFKKKLSRIGVAFN